MKYAALAFVLILASCSSPAEIEHVRPVEVRTIEVPRPAPIVPSVDQLRLRSVNWIIITPDNVEESFARIQSGELVLFAVTAEGYENIALNLSDVRAMIEQQQRIIAIYQRQFSR
jgi:hypothetical protein